MSNSMCNRCQLCWWQHYVGYFIMVTRSLCLQLFTLCWWIFQRIKSVTTILNRSSTSLTCHQHILSPTSVTNIDVTIENLDENNLLPEKMFTTWRCGLCCTLGLLLWCLLKNFCCWKWDWIAGLLWLLFWCPFWPCGIFGTFVPAGWELIICCSGSNRLFSCLLCFRLCILELCFELWTFEEILLFRIFINR